MQETIHETNLSFGQLFANVTQSVGTLMRKELELARVEMRDKVSNSGKDAAMLAIGGAILFAGFLVALIAAVAALALVLPVWAAALLVAAVVMIIGGILFTVGMQRLKKTDLKPTQAITSFKESKQWMKEQLT
jgi:dipeptide/tripeptide permease